MSVYFALYRIGRVCNCKAGHLEKRAGHGAQRRRNAFQKPDEEVRSSLFPFAISGGPSKLSFGQKRLIYG
jgi:hypothetical protein